MNRDPELPNGFRDADFEMRELYELGAKSAALHKQGLCDHGWRQVGQINNNVPVGLAKCLHCGKLATEAELDEERRELLN
jgi:hypothetical protein